MSKKATKSSKTPTDIHAIPDGKFHFTEEQKQLLAEFEATNPLAVEHSVNEMPEIDFDLADLSPTEQALVNFVHDVTAGKPIDKDRWLEAVVDYIRTYNTSMVLWYVFSQLEIHLPQNHYTLFDIIELYVLMLSCFDNYSIARDLPYPNNYHMYHFIRRHLTDKAMLIEQLKPLQATRFHYLKHSRVQDFFVYVFPDEMIATANLEDLKLTESGDEMWRFFYAMPVFAKSYAQRVRNYTPRGFDQNAYEKGMNETYLLFTIAHQQTAVVKLIDAYFQRTAEINQSGDWRKSDYPKIRNNLNFLEAYHHVDVLDFLTIYADDTVVEKCLKNWLKRYPLVTLNHFLTKLPERHPRCVTALKNLIITTLLNNPALIALLQAMLDDTQQALLTELITLIPRDVLENTDKEPVKAKSPTKIDEPKALKFPSLALQRLPFTPKFSIGMLSEYNESGYVSIKPQHQKQFALMLVEPNEYLFQLYQDSYLPNELPLLQQAYADFDDNQKILAYLFASPSFLLSDNYQKAVQGEYLLTEYDYSPIVFSIRQHFYINGGNIHGYEWLAVAIKSLPLTLKKAVLQGGFPFQKYNYHQTWYGLANIMYAWANLLSEDCDETLVTTFFERDLLPIRQSKDLILRETVLKVFQGLDHPKAVADMLNAFNTKTFKKYAIRYSQRYLPTMINETVYLLFAKLTDEHDKKARKNAKPFFDYLIENHKAELIATLQAYDKQLATPVLETFLADYQANQLILQHQTKTTVEHDIAQGTDLTGTPLILTNDDWQKLTKKRNLTLPLDLNLAELPPLIIASTGQPLALDGYAHLIKMLMLSEVGEPFSLLLPTLAYITPESQIALADKLWTRYYTPDSKNKWRILASGLLYHPTLDDKVCDYMKAQESDPTARAYLRHSFTTLAEQAIIRHQLAKDGIEAEQNRSLGNKALRMLIKLSQKARTTLRPVAEKELKRYADKMGLTADDLADRVLPTLGLNAQGKRIFDFGNRQFTMSLNANLEPEFTDSTGRKLKKLPTPNPNDDEQLANQAINDFKEVKKALTAFKREDVPRLELMMVNQRRIDFADFEQFFIKNPLMLRITYQLIWGVYDKTDKTKLTMPFRVVETGEILDIDDDELKITDDSLIGLVHPLDLTEEQKAKFGQALQDDNIIQPILQLARPTFTLSDDEKTNGKITRFEKEKFATGSLIGLKNKGWVDGMGSGGVCEYYDKKVAIADWHFGFTGYQMWGGVPADDKGQEIDTINVPKEANAVSVSEFLYVIDSMARLEN